MVSRQSGAVEPDPDEFEAGRIQPGKLLHLIAIGIGRKLVAVGEVVTGNEYRAGDDQKTND
jgi:hypothetical protein